FGVTAMSEQVRYLPNQAIAVLSVDAPGPYGWPIALLVLGCWAAAGLLCGGLLLRTPDACTAHSSGRAFVRQPRQAAGSAQSAAAERSLTRLSRSWRARAAAPRA